MFEGILQPTHLILILVIVLVVFGPGKLPEIGGALGKGLSEFKHSVGGSSEPQNSVKNEAPKADPVSSGNLCRSCGHENLAGQQFCGACGAKIG